MTDADRLFYRYCLVGKTRVLMADFTWKPISDVTIGEQIITVTEYGGVQWQGERSRNWILATITAKKKSTRPCLKLTLSDGAQLELTEDHSVLVQSGGHLKWVTAGNLRCDSVFKSRLTRATRYVQQSSLDAAWLGGLLDGEGSITGTQLGKGHCNAQRGWGYLNFTQKPGAVLQQALRILRDHNFDFVVKTRPEDGCCTVCIRGAVRESIAALLLFRPVRLMQNLLKVIGSGSVRATKFQHPVLTTKELTGDQEVYDITTTAHTFIAEGLVVHNCGMDCCVTYECNQVMDGKLMPGQRKHYQFNLNLLAPILYMELRGIRYDHEKAKAKLKRVQRWIYVLQDILNRAAGKGLDEQLAVCRDATAGSETHSESVGDASEKGEVPKRSGQCDKRDKESALIKLIAANLCKAKPRRARIVETTRTFKNGKVKTTSKRISEPVEITTHEDCREFALESKASEVREACSLIKAGIGGRERRGHLSVVLGTHLKVNSTGGEGEACEFLYKWVGYEPQYQKEGNRLTDRLASDDEALIKIYIGETKKPQPWGGGGVRFKSRGRIVLAFLKLRRLITQTKTLRIAPDSDGRMRCAYNVVGTETARLTCYESPTGSGYNMQTTTKPHRDLFLADEGCLLAQCDLSGADGWTVASYAAAQGDRTMLDDYKAGIKPAKIGVLMWKQGAEINKLPREQLKALCKQVDGDSWEYFGFKRVQHGSSYLMGKITMSDQILTDSWKLTGKPVVLPPATCEQMQKTCFFARYWGIPRWHAWTERELKGNGYLIASNGFKRLFFGRKDDHDTLKQALAHLPQVYTTYATMMALARCWSDPDNRNKDGSLKVEANHTVHDSILFSFSRPHKDWACAKIRGWFNNELQIAQEKLVIPFEGAVGRDWKHLDEGVI